MTTAAKRLTLVISFLCTYAFNGNALTYTTLTNGIWSDVTNVWSTNGVTPCGCTPGATSAGNDIVVNHQITTSYTLVINAGSVFTVNPGGQILGSDDVITFNASIDFFGPVSLNKLSVATGATVTLHNGAILNMNNQLQVTFGIFINDGGLSNSGGISVDPTASLITMNGARMHVVSGNMTNNGFIDVCPTCCMSSNGNWRNTSTGTVSGSGAVNSGGNINNQGTWDINLSWCATGSGIGLPTPENCATAQGVCFAITLPVELSSFEVAPVENEYVQVLWSTATELNSSYFNIERSPDGNNWEVIAKVDAQGNSSETTHYSYTDYDAQPDENYYRLVEFDTDGRSFSSEIAMATLHAEDFIRVYPNPVSGATTITVEGVENGETLYILNSSGTISAQEQANTFSRSVRMDISHLDPGMYFVRTGRTDNSNPVKLIVTR